MGLEEMNKQAKREREKRHAVWCSQQRIQRRMPALISALNASDWVDAYDQAGFIEQEAEELSRVVGILKDDCYARG